MTRADAHAIAHSEWCDFMCKDLVAELVFQHSQADTQEKRHRAWLALLALDLNFTAIPSSWPVEQADPIARWKSTPLERPARAVLHAYLVLLFTAERKDRDRAADLLGEFSKQVEKLVRGIAA